MVHIHFNTIIYSSVYRKQMRVFACAFSSIFFMYSACPIFTTSYTLSNIFCTCHHTSICSMVRSLSQFALQLWIIIIAPLCICINIPSIIWMFSSVTMFPFVCVGVLCTWMFLYVCVGVWYKCNTFVYILERFRYPHTHTYTIHTPYIHNTTHIVKNTSFGICSSKTINSYG